MNKYAGFSRLKTSFFSLLLALAAGLSVAVASAAQSETGRFGELQRTLTERLAAGEPAGEVLDELRRLAESRSPRAGQPRAAQGVQLRQQLLSLQSALERIVRDGPQPADVQIVAGRFQAVQAAHLLMNERFAAVAQRLEAGVAGAAAAQRLAAFRGEYHDKIDALFAELEPVLARYINAEDPAAVAADKGFAGELRKAGATALESLRGSLSRPPAPILGNRFLPYRQLPLERRTPELDTAVVPSYADPQAGDPAGADLAATVDAPLSRAVLAQAEALDYDYIRIYEFVKNEIRTEWYAGAMKGADGTLAGRSGNDVDQASLLIALFRASGLASRYVQGTVEVSLETVARSLGWTDERLAAGGLFSAAQIGRALNRAGIAYEPVVRGGRVAAYNLEHTWVAAHVPYTNYRGAMVDASGSIWLPLAPALKDYEVTAANDIVSEAGIDAASFIDDYLQGTRVEDPLTRLEAQLTDYLQTARPGETPAGQAGSVAVRPGVRGLLPSTLPVTVVNVHRETAELPAGQRHRVRFVMRAGVNPGDPVVLETTEALASLAGRRVTLSYQPATVDDQATVNAFGGLDLTPAYLIELRPQLKVDGRKRAVAAGSLDAGVQHRLEIELVTPNGTERIGQTVLSGGYHAVALATGGEVFNPEDRTIQACTEEGGPDCAGAEDPADTEYLGARLLSAVAYDYTDRWQQAEERLAGLLDTALVRPLASVAVVGNAMQAEMILGRPGQLRWEAVTLDAALRVAQPLGRQAQSTAAVNAERDFMRLAALQGSHEEHRVFEELFLVDSISADKGLQLARERGAPVVTLNEANFALEQASLTHPPHVLDAIGGWIGRGFTVTTPVQPVAYQAWQGHLWHVENPGDGSSGWFIAGGLAGASTAQAGGDWVLDYISGALEGMNAPPPNYNPSDAVSIVKLPGGDGQRGIAGRPLEQPFAVMVLDAVYAPVQGADVVFSVASGGGKFDNDEPVKVVTTDRFGVASATLTTGPRTDLEPVFLKQNENDAIASRAGWNQVEAVATSSAGILTIDRPFSAVAFPGPPVELVQTAAKKLGTRSLGDALFMNVQARDSFGNSVANIPIDFEAFSQSPIDNCSADTAAQVRTDNGGTGAEVSEPTYVNGAAATLVAGAGYAEYGLRATAVVDDNPLAPVLSAVADGFGCRACGEVSHRRVTTVDEFGNNLQAALAGEAPETPLASKVYVASDVIGEQPSDLLSVAHVATSEDAEAGETTPRGDGLYEYFLTTSPVPGYNTAQAEVTNFKEAITAAGLPLCAPLIDLDTPLRYNAAGAAGLKLMITGITSQHVPEGLDPGTVPLDAEDRTAYPVEIRFNVEPQAYVSLIRELDFFADGQWTGFKPLASRSGSGSVTLARGVEFDPEKTHEIELVLNRGTEFELRSERVELPVRQPLVLAYGSSQEGVRSSTREKSIYVSHEIDTLNQRSCNIGSTFHFELSEASQVTLELLDETNGSSVTTLIDGQSYPAGENKYSILPGDVSPGRYIFVLTAEASSDGLVERHQGVALVEFTLRNNLPVGHTLVKGVDVFDGNLSVASEDLKVPGRGPALELRRSYSSNHSALPGPLGVGWTHNYLSHVVTRPCGEVIVMGAAGGGIRFVDNGSGGLEPLKGYHGTLEHNLADNSYDFYSVDGTRYHYRNFGRTEWDLVFIEDTNGNITRLGYDAGSPDKAKLGTVEDPVGRRIEFTYESRRFDGHFENTDVVVRAEVKGVDAPLIVTYEYDEFGNLVRAVRRDGEDNELRAEGYAYNTYELDDNGDPVLDDNGNPSLLPIFARHKLNTYTDPNGHSTTYEYEQTRQVFSTPGGVQVNAPYSSVRQVVEPVDGARRQVTAFDYDFTAGTTGLTNARGVDNRFEMNTYGSVSRLEKPFGATETQWSDEDVLPLARTNARDVRATFGYDEHGNVLTERVADQFNRAFTYAGFDGGTIKNRVETRTDRNGHTTEFEYDDKGNLVRVTDPEGGVTVHGYNDRGDRLSTRDPRGNVTQFRYDEYGNLSQVIDALGHVTKTDWNKRGLPVRITDANGNVTVHDYDDLGRRILTVNPDGTEVSFTWDDAGNKRTETDERGFTTTFDYDQQNRLIRETRPDGSFREMDYDENGNQILERDWNGNVTTFEYDADDRLERKTEPEGRVTEYTYDAVGNKLTETVLDANDPTGETAQTTTWTYDALNRVETVTDPEGGVTAYSYDGEGNKLTETDPEGRTTTFEYDKNNRLEKITDPEGGVTIHEYDFNGNKTAEIDAKGRRRELVYDELNRLRIERDALGHATTYDYDKAGNRISVIDARLHETRFAYDEMNRKIKETDPKGFETGFDYDDAGNLTEERLPNGNVVIHTYNNLNRLERSEDNEGPLLTKRYDGNGNVLEQTDANGNVTVNEYDGLDRLEMRTAPEGRVTKFTYDVFGNKRTETDPEGHTTTFQYDGNNRLVLETDPRGYSRTLGYDKAGNKRSETDKRGHTTIFGYDKLNRLTSITDPNGDTVIRTYDAVGNLETETDKRGTLTVHTYDKENRLETTTKDGLKILRNEYDPVGNKSLEEDAKGNKVVFIYDERDQVIEQSRPLAAITRFRYDAMGNKEWERDPEGRVTTFDYDLRDRLISRTNGEGETETYDHDGNGNRTLLRRPEGNEWTYVYDDADRLEQVIDPRGNVTGYGYDLNDNRTRQTDANGHTTEFGYDELNRRERIVYDDGNEVTFGYDENGNRISMTNANGRAFTYVFDELNRETDIQYPLPADPTGDDIRTIVKDYDKNGNLERITEAYSGTTGTRITRQRFDKFDRLFEKTDPDGKVIVYGYDANGNRETVTDPDGLVTTYTYDALNRVDTVTNAQGVTDYDYDRSSLKTKVTYPNGTEAAWTYDDAGRIETIENRQSGAVVSSYSYIYDDNGNRTQQTEVNGGAAEVTTYDFDNLDRLEQVTYPDKTTTYTYDAAYNRETETTREGTETTEDKTYSYNNRNQVTSITDSISGEQIQYDYDANGNRTQKTVIPADAGIQTITEFVYDVRDQLRQITQGGSSVGQFLYDYQGLRTRKQTGTEIVRYVYDDQSVLIQTDDLGATVAKYDYGPDRLLSLNHATEGTQFYLFDALGSVVNLTKTDGAIQARYQYDAWGNYRNQVGGSANVFGFTGHEMDTETGLIYMKARFYDPELGLFLSHDAFEGTVGTPPSLHKYLYALANPVVFVDPDGNAAVVESGDLERLQQAFESDRTLVDPGQGLLTLAQQEEIEIEEIKVPGATNGMLIKHGIDPAGVQQLMKRLESARRDPTRSSSAFVIAEAEDTPDTLLQFANDFVGDTGSVLTAEILKQVIAQKKLGIGDTVIDVSPEFDDAVMGAYRQREEKGLVNKATKFFREAGKPFGKAGEIATLPAQILASPFAIPENIAADFGVTPGSERAPKPVRRESAKAGAEAAVLTVSGLGILKARRQAVAAEQMRELQFGRKLDFLFNRNINPARPRNVQRARGNADRIGIADTPENRAEVARRFNEAFNDPASIVSPGKTPGSNLREFFLPGKTSTGSKIQFVEKDGKIITIIAE